MSAEPNILLRTPPQNLEAEQSVLGAILLDNDAIDRACEIVDVEDFYRQSHRQIFQAMLDLASARKPIDPVTLPAQLGSKVEEIGGIGYLTELAAMYRPRGISRTTPGTFVRRRFSGTREVL